MDKDEAFYKKFSELIEATIKAFNEDRLSEKEYLDKILEVRDNLENGYQEGIPESIVNKPNARAFFGALNEVLENIHGKDKVQNIANQLAQAGIEISAIVEKLTIRDWKKNLDVQRQMENEIEDFLMENRKMLGIELTFDEIDEILIKALKIAKHNY